MPGLRRRSPAGAVAAGRSTPLPNCGCLIWFDCAGRRQLDPGRIEQTKEAIRDWVGHITELSKSRIPPAEYFAASLDGLVRMLAARGGAFWLVDRGKLRVQYHVGLENVGISESSLRGPAHIRLLEAALAEQTASLTPPRLTSQTVQEQANPTDSLLLLCPVMHAGETERLSMLSSVPTRARPRRRVISDSSSRFVRLRARAPLFALSRSSLGGNSGGKRGRLRWPSRLVGETLTALCRKSNREVGPLVEGPGRVYICSHCIRLCAEPNREGVRTARQTAERVMRRRGRGSQNSEAVP